MKPGVVLVAALLSVAQSAPTRIVVNGVELHYIERGQGEPIILLHGGQGDYRAWQPQMDALSAHYRVISYSRRFHYPNKNPIRGTDYSALVDAKDLAAFVAALKLDRVHLVGTSYGALTAMAFAIDHADQVRSMVLAEPPVDPWVAETARGRQLTDEFMQNVHNRAGALFKAGDDVAAMRLFIDAFDVKGAFDALPPDRREVAMENATFFKALTASVDPFPNLPKDRVRRLRMPILVIHGANTDELHAMDAANVAGVFPNATTAVIPNAGHGSPRQNPQAFTAAVAEFLAKQR
jgi:pimeloyl-ACP methyl ester carboxylesterase